MKLISEEYRALNAELHQRKVKYGAKGHDWADRVIVYLQNAQAATYLDYGCGKGSLAQAIMDRRAEWCLDGGVYKYDPVTAPEMPEKADFVTCCDVLEHIEPELLDNVLEHIRSVTRHQGLLVISQRLANKRLADGRNAHLLVKPTMWWMTRLAPYFTVTEVPPIKPKRVGVELAVLVTPK